MKITQQQLQFSQLPPGKIQTIQPANAASQSGLSQQEAQSFLAVLKKLLGGAPAINGQNSQISPNIANSQNFKTLSPDLWRTIAYEQVVDGVPSYIINAEDAYKLINSARSI